MHNPCSRTTASPTLEHTWISGLDVQALGKAASMEPCISQPAPKEGEAACCCGSEEVGHFRGAAAPTAM